MNKPEAKDQSASGFSFLIRAVVLLLIAIVFGYLYANYSQWLTLDNLAQHEQRLLDYRDAHWFWVLAAAFGVYILVTGLSLPGGAVLTLVTAWFLGFWPALILVSFASTIGATVAFSLSRFLFRDYVQNRFGNRLKAFNENLEREGAFYLFTLRLIPTVPFFAINLAMGPTRIRTWTFYWVSQIGMLPGTIAYVWAGSAAPSLQTLSEKGIGGILTWPLILAFLFLSLVPWLAKWSVAAMRSSQNAPKAKG